MAADQHAREKLVRFLDEQAVDPILGADPECYSGTDRQKLENVGGPTERMQQRCHDDSTSAEEVRDRLRDDLSSSAAQRVQREIESLRRLTRHDVEDEFEDLCRDLGIGR